MKKQEKRTNKTPTAKAVGSDGLVSHAFAWKIKNNFTGNKWVLCRWSAPYKHDLLREAPPSPEAKVVRVRMTAGRV